MVQKKNIIEVMTRTRLNMCFKEECAHEKMYVVVYGESLWTFVRKILTAEHDFGGSWTSWHKIAFSIKGYIFPFIPFFAKYYSKFKIKFGRNVNSFHCPYTGNDFT